MPQTTSLIPTVGDMTLLTWAEQHEARRPSGQNHQTTIS
jgi:hypothetical protein